MVLILGMQVSVFLNASAVTTWATPVFWTGLILVFDAMLFAGSGASLIRTVAILPVAVISVVSWWVFEWFNIFLSNWHYINLANPLGLRYLGFIWAFATIIPGVLLTYGILGGFFKKLKGRPLMISRGLLVSCFLSGLFFLAIPIVPFSMYYLGRAADESLFFFLTWSANTHLSEYTAAFVWTGFVLLLEPLNYAMGNRCLLRSFREGEYGPLAALSSAGFLCGYLWEFWNYWAHTKWYYTVPILGHIKIFEMPVLGYFGFIPFAWELYNMVSLIYPRAIDIVEGRSA
jgi:hypothetical protein